MKKPTNVVIDRVTKIAPLMRFRCESCTKTTPRDACCIKVEGRKVVTSERFSWCAFAFHARCYAALPQEWKP